MEGLFSGELNFGGAYYWNKFCVSKRVDLDNKNSLRHYKTQRKQPKGAFLLSELASQTGQFANGMHRFEGLVL